MAEKALPADSEEANILTARLVPAAVVRRSGSQNPMTKDEQETILRWDAGGEFVTIFTAHPPTMRKLDRADYRPYRVNTRSGREDGWFYRVPVAELRWRVGARRTLRRRLTEAEREARRERLARARQARVS